MQKGKHHYAQRTPRCFQGGKTANHQALAHEYNFTVIDGQQPIKVISEEILKEINCLLML